MRFRAAEVVHVPSLECFGYSVRFAGKTLMYSGDDTMCPALLDLAKDADVLVLDCNCGDDTIHLGREDAETILAQAPAHSKAILSHLDTAEIAGANPRITAASDLLKLKF